MKRENLIGYMRDPSMLSQSSLPEVEELASEYPFFQTAHLLLAKNHHNLDSLKFHDMLRSAAAFAGDRTVLFHLIHPDTIMAQRKSGPLQAGAGAMQADDEDVPTEAIQAGSEGDIGQGTDISGRLADILNRESVDTDLEYTTAYSFEDEVPDKGSPVLEEYTFTGWFDRLGDRNADEGSSPEQNDLIDKFLEEKPGIKADPDPEYDKTDRSEAFTMAGDSLMTETLAKIYLQQGLLKKAIYAYEKLSLKYPEKSTYFATQINRIRNKLAEN
jgi:hypothetical protein